MREEDRIKEYLNSVSLFSELSEIDVAELTRSAQIETYAKGDYIFFEDDANDWLYSPLKGRLKLVKHLESGRDVILTVIGPGDIVGEGPVYEGKNQPASLQAMELSDVARIQRPALLSVLKHYPLILERLIAIESALLRDSFEQIKNLSGERVMRRIAIVILKLAAKMGKLQKDDSVKIDLRITRQDIANMAGSTVETAIRTISKLTSDGILETRGGYIYITDRHHLVEIAENINT